MIDSQWTDERGWRTDLLAPLTADDTRSDRLAQLDDVLTAFQPVLRPLVAEVVMCWRERDTHLPHNPATGLPSKADSWPRRRIFAVDGALPRVTARPMYVNPPPIEIVPVIDSALIAASLDSEPSPDPDLEFDWLEVHTLAVAVRAFVPIDAIKMKWFGQDLAPHDPDWFAGPISERDYERVPPARFTVLADGRVSLRMAVYWSRWWSADTEESAAIERGISALRARGWTEE